MATKVLALVKTPTLRAQVAERGALIAAETFDAPTYVARLEALLATETLRARQEVLDVQTILGSDVDRMDYFLPPRLKRATQTREDSVLENTSYVKQIVFPLEILVPVAIGSAAVHAVISFAVLASFMLLFTGTIPVTVLWLPVVVGPLLVLTLGLGWFLTSVGVYLRDLGQLTGPLMSGLMFLSPIFYPSSAQPEWLRAWLRLNPLTLPIEQARNAVIWGVTPDLIGLVVYTMIALGVAVLGYLWFQKTRKGFADVI